MIARLSISGILNEIAEPVRTLSAPWVGVLIVLVLPLRLLQVHFVNVLIELDDDAGNYGNLLQSIALLLWIASLLATYGRAVFARAVHRHLGHEEIRPDVFRIRPAALLNLMYVVLLLQCGLAALAFTLIAIPIFSVLIGIAIATVDRHERPSVTEPLRLIGRFLGEARILVGVTLVFAIALFASWVNLVYASRIALWLAEAVPTVTLDRWEFLLSPSHRLFNLLTLAVALIIVEPFWIAANVVYVRRAEAKETGDDLRRWFRANIARAKDRRIAVGFFLVAALTLPHSSFGETLSLSAYAERLESIESALTSNDKARAAGEAAAISNAEVRAGREVFHADRSLLEPVARQEGDPFDQTLRLRALIRALRGSERPAAEQVDRDLLAKIREEHRVDPLRRGGKVPMLQRSDSKLWELIVDWYNAAIRWLAEKIGWLVDWLRKLWPELREGERRSDIQLLVLVVTLLIVGVLIALAIANLKRSRRRALVAQSTPLVTDERRDADPLSREANEWERYALELARAGKLREAIRAWYHAVLVALYRAGVLNYRKGATNWEYVTRLSSSLAWRSKFVDMTRRFEREWYGRDRSTADVLEEHAAQARVILSAIRARSEP